MVLTVCFVLPGDLALLPPSSAELLFRELDTSVGVSGPHGPILGRGWNYWDDKEPTGTFAITSHHKRSRISADLPAIGSRTQANVPCKDRPEALAPEAATHRNGRCPESLDHDDDRHHQARTAPKQDPHPCEAKVERPDKLYDKECSNLYVSVSPTSPATFYLKYSCPFTHKRRAYRMGVYRHDNLTPDRARIEAMKLKYRLARGEDISLDHRKPTKREGLTVGDMIDKRIAWMQQPELKDEFGTTAPRIETWKNVAGHLNHLVRPALGRMLATEVTRQDINKLSQDIVDEALKAKRKGVAARHMQRAISGMYSWAAEHGYVPETCRPCFKLTKVKEYSRTRVLSEHEVRTLWHGLDREDMPWDRKTRLAIKFALITMLRSVELLGIHRDELNTENGTVDIPARRVKKRRVINQPLSDLALEIIDEAMGNYDHAFTGRFGDAPLSRQAMSSALTGTKKLVKGVKVTRTPGICALLGLEPFTPHDLRRTAATMCGELGLSESGISACLDHQANKDEKAAASDHPQGLQLRHAGPGSEEARGARCMGYRAAPHRRRAGRSEG
jgi:integrase